MGVSSYWDSRKRFLRRIGPPRPVWRLLIMLAVILYMIYYLDKILSQ